jgi:hypothetical protein
MTSDEKKGAMVKETHRPSPESAEYKLVRRPFRLRVEPSFPSTAALGTVGSLVDVIPQVNAVSKSSNSKMHL